MINASSVQHLHFSAPQNSTQHSHIHRFA
jgi:hypothetical protein